jgi:hypothetical protein
MYGEPTLSVIDLVQEYLEVTGWNFEREGQNLIKFEFVGSWNIYKFAVAEKPSFGEALIQCQLVFTIPVVAGAGDTAALLVRVVASLRHLFDLIHGDLPRGTFYSLPLAGQQITINWVYRLKLGETIDEQLLEDSLNEALAEIDEFYPAICQVLTGTVSAAEAYKNAIPEVYGCA